MSTDYRTASHPPQPSIIVCDSKSLTAPGTTAWSAEAINTVLSLSTVLPASDTQQLVVIMPEIAAWGVDWPSFRSAWSQVASDTHMRVTLRLITSSSNWGEQDAESSMSYGEGDVTLRVQLYTREFLSGRDAWNAIFGENGLNLHTQHGPWSADFETTLRIGTWSEHDLKPQRICVVTSLNGELRVQPYLVDYRPTL